MGGGVELKSTPDLDILYFLFTISRYEWKVNRIFKSKMKKIFKPSNYLENYSSCVVYVPSCAVCISTLASSTVTSNQHTNKTSNYVHYHQEIQARVHYTEDVQHVKLCETWASFGQVIFSQVVNLNRCEIIGIIKKYCLGNHIITSAKFVNIQWGNLVENNLMTQFKLMNYFDGQNLEKFGSEFLGQNPKVKKILKFPLAFDGECKADFCQL